jgi:hypothetical protein
MALQAERPKHAFFTQMFPAPLKGCEVDKLQLENKRKHFSSRPANEEKKGRATM